MNHGIIKRWGQSRAIRLEDKLMYFPVDGAKKELCLMRTKYYLGGVKSQFELWGHDLPQVKIIWIPLSQNDKQGVYIIESICEEPFILNETLTWKSVLSHGDEVKIGYNRFVFTRSQGEQSEGGCLSVEEKAIYQSQINIVLEGETGTGKSYLAKKIHGHSGLGGQFVHVNLAAFSRDLIESELFGHVKGAFTGAINDKKGAIEQAHRGTLFLDEIDSLPLDIQLKLLLFLDNKKVRAVGDRRDKKVDVRLIFASGRALKACVQSGSMRKDFYYRMTGGQLYRLKSLKESREKISSFIQAYLFSKDYYISPSLQDYYSQLSWPGNYRQLKSHLDKKMVLCTSKKLMLNEIDNDLITQDVSGEIQKTFYDNELSLDELKDNYILQTFKQLGSFKATSVKLGVTEKTIRKRLKELSGGNYEHSMLQ